LARNGQPIDLTWQFRAHLFDTLLWCALLDGR